MTKQEYAAWVAVTKQSETAWQLDEVHWHNDGELLVYKGGTNGIFLWAEKDGNVLMGVYSAALPHIGDAIFDVQYGRKVADTASDAFAIVAAKLGLPGLPALLGF